MPILVRARQNFHRSLTIGNQPPLVFDNGTATIADGGNNTSVAIANHIAHAIGAQNGHRLSPQALGNIFEQKIRDFIIESFTHLSNLRPGNWSIIQEHRNGVVLSRYLQYHHLGEIDDIVQNNPQLAAALGNNYAVSPDIVVIRNLETDESINAEELIVDNTIAKNSDIRFSEGKMPFLHAIISAKWTIRSDRVQNARAEALNLIRNRKGRTPHITVVTCEPSPSRLAAIALGTGDIDCVYHLALYELVEAVNNLNNDEASSMLDILISGNRLKDISDLPLDLAV